MNIEQSLDPGVIDNEMIRKAVEEQGPTGEAGRLAKEDGFQMDEVKSIRLEFLNIIKIDHLWMLTALTKLYLGNNHIEKIENLELLVNLQELDLSTNHIEKIENVSTLVNIQTLRLYKNLIITLENMEALTKLKVFSIGHNKIDNLNNILYLRQFDDLRSLNMVGNPCCNMDNFRRFIAAFLPDLTYYEYRMIFTNERTEAFEFYKFEINKVIASEAESKRHKEIAIANAAEEAYHSESFVEYLGGRMLFDEMFDKDDCCKAIMLLDDESEQTYISYENEFLNTTKRLFDIGLEMYSIRKEEVSQFFKCVDSAKDESQIRSQKCMEDFLEKKALLFMDIRRLQADLQEKDTAGVEGEKIMSGYLRHIEEIACEFHDDIRTSWKELMGIELVLYEQLEDTNTTFEHNLTDLINNFLEIAQGIFNECRHLESMFSERLNDIGHNYIVEREAAAATRTVVVEGPENMIYDRESLFNAVTASHDKHIQAIDAREDRLLLKARSWLKNLVDNLSKDEIRRNRNKILEINHFLDIQREEFDELNSTPVGAVLDPDITAALSI